MLSWQEEQIQSLLSAKNDAAFFAVLSRITLKLGFDFCSYVMRLPLPVADPKLVILNNYSPSWQQRYMQENYIAVDPTVALGMKSTSPILWSDEIFAKSRAFWEDAQAHGLNVGWAQSCHDSRGIGGMLSLARSDDNLTTAELNDISLKMSWLAQASHQALSRLIVPKFLPEAATELTLREIEVLRWTADGKTSNEVGDIMHISERTVNFHVTNALIKLNAPNKTAAAIKAALLGML